MDQRMKDFLGELPLTDTQLRILRDAIDLYTDEPTQEEREEFEGRYGFPHDAVAKLDTILADAIKANEGSEALIISGKMVRFLADAVKDYAEQSLTLYTHGALAFRRNADHELTTHFHNIKETLAAFHWRFPADVPELP